MSVYRELVAAGCEVDHHESDLYARATPRANAIIAAHAVNAVRFASAIDGSPWWDLPFAYDPFWERAAARSDRKRRQDTGEER